MVRDVTDFVYIMSPSYSGSTLLTFLLASHPEIATIGELKATHMGDIDAYDCSCGTRIGDCSFWQKLSADLNEQGLAFDLTDFGTHFHGEPGTLTDRALRAGVRGPVLEAARSMVLSTWPAARRACRRTLARNVALIHEIKRLQGGEVFLDGSKDPNRLRYFLSAGLGAIKVIYMIRDGRGKACSYMRHYNTDMADAAAEWRDAHEECERMLARLPAGSTFTLHYEDLCGDPDQWLARVFEFLGLDADQATRDFNAFEHHIIGNAMRLSSSSEIVLDERWKRDLTEADLAAFEQVAGDLNRRYGYE